MLNSEKSISERLFTILFPKKNNFINELTKQIENQVGWTSAQQCISFEFYYKINTLNIKKSL